MPKPLRWIPLATLALAASAWLPSDRSVRPQAQPPTGTLDRVADGFAEGWALDPDAPSQAVTVRFYVDAAYPQGTLAGEITTDIIRADVNLDRGVSGAHGFRWAIPAGWADGRPHRLYAYESTRSIPACSLSCSSHPSLSRWGPRPRFLMLTNPTRSAPGISPHGVRSTIFKP